MYKQNSKLVCLNLKNTKKRYTVGFYAILRYIERNQLLRAQQNQEDTDTVTVYLFLAKNTIPLFKTANQEVYRSFPPSLQYIEEKLAVEGRTKSRGGYRYTVYCHDIPLYGKKYDVIFNS